jgi:chloramphenicol 3-O phosphotransferase
MFLLAVSSIGQVTVQKPNGNVVVDKGNPMLHLPDLRAALAIITLIVVGLYIFKYCQKCPKHSSGKPGTVIILNGPSGSGKSSIQKEFQSLMMLQPSHKAPADRLDLWIKLGIDTLFDKPMPDITQENMEFWQSKNPIRWVSSTTDEQQNAIITLFTGEQGEKVAYGMNSAIAAYAQNGCNIIVDYIAYKKEWIHDLKNKLKNVPTVWVKVSIPLDVVEQREAARATSPKGHARSHFNTVYWDINYDLTVETDKKSAVEIARELKEKFVH